jgi:cobalt-zinc-cadmium efflux system membrane fusion protein
VKKGLGGGETVVASGAFLLKSDVLRSKMGAGCAD